MQSVQRGVLLSFLSVSTNRRARMNSLFSIPRDEAARTGALSIKVACSAGRLVAMLTMKYIVYCARVTCRKRKYRNAGTLEITVSANPNLPLPRRVSQGLAA